MRGGVKPASYFILLIIIAGGRDSGGDDRLTRVKEENDE
jgi:hypothetical protein